MKAQRKSGAVVGAIGLVISALCLILFWAFTPIVFLPLLIGVPASGYAWHCGWRGLALAGFVVALAPALFIAFEALDWIMGLVALVPAGITVAVVWFAGRHQPVVVQANNSLQRP
jgi:hypothetical protein